MSELEVDAPTFKSLSFSQKVLVWCLHKVLFCWYLTWRISCDAEAEKLLTPEGSKAKIIVFWHNRLMIVPMLVHAFYRKKLRIIALVSSSSDGAYLAELLRYYNAGTARGSSSKRSLTATRELIRYLKEGCLIGITPDGPRGPKYVLKPGAVMVAKVCRAPIALLSADYSSAWKLNRAWDGFMLPKPFARIHFKAKLYNELPEGDYETVANTLQTELLALTENR